MAEPLGKWRVFRHPTQRKIVKKLFRTCYTANLAGDIREKLRKICSVDEIRRIEVVNLDSWIASFLREQGYNSEIIYDNGISDLWEDAMVNGDAH